MTAWPNVSLFDICNPKQWPTISQDEFVEIGFPVYGANGKIGFYTDYNHEQPTVLITCRGATCGTINVCEAKSYVTGNSMALDNLDTKQVTPEFLVLALKKIGLQKAISGTAQPQITRQSLAAIKVPLPPLPEQRRIADILDRAEALRAQRRAALKLLDTLPQAIFLEMFGDPIENNYNFHVKPLIELIDPARPISYGILMPGPDQEVGVKYVRVVDMKDGGIDLSGIRKTTEKMSNEFRRSLLKAGDLLMSIRGHVGRMAIVPSELTSANITQDSARLAINGASAIYVRECIRSVGFQRWMAKHTKGVAVRGINLGDVKIMPIPLPTEAAQETFARRVAAVEQLRASQRTSLAKLDELFAALQHRAFRGEL